MQCCRRRWLVKGGGKGSRRYRSAEPFPCSSLFVYAEGNSSQRLARLLCSSTMAIFFIRLVVPSIFAELGGVKVTAQLLGGPNDNPGFKVQRGLNMFVVQGEEANEEDGVDGAVWFFSFEGGAETVTAGVTV